MTRSVRRSLLACGARAMVLAMASLVSGCQLLAGIDTKVWQPPALTSGAGGDSSSVGAGPGGGGTGPACTDSPAELMIDPENCGSCGHNCLGDKCSAGLCLPRRISSYGAAALAVSPTFVYGAYEGINRSPIDGSGPTESLTYAQLGKVLSLDVHLDEGCMDCMIAFVGFKQVGGATEGHLYTLNTSAQPTGIQIVGPDLQSVSRLHIGELAYTVAGSTDATMNTDSFIQRVSMETGEATTLRYETAPTLVDALAGDKDFDYFADGGTHLIGKYPVNGDQLIVVDQNTVGPSALILTDDGYLFWGNDSVIYRKPANADATTLPDIIGGVPARVISLAVDETYVYFAARDDGGSPGTVGRYRRDAAGQTEPKTLATALQGPQALAVFGPWLFIGATDGIYRLVR